MTHCNNEMCESVVNPNVGDKGYVTWWIQDLLIVQNHCPSSVFFFSTPSMLVNSLAKRRNRHLVKSICLVANSMLTMWLVKLNPNDFCSTTSWWGGSRSYGPYSHQDNEEPRSYELNFQLLVFSGDTQFKDVQTWQKPIHVCFTQKSTSKTSYKPSDTTKNIDFHC